MINGKGYYKVVFDSGNESITRSSTKFENMGIMYNHVLKVYDVNDVKILLICLLYIGGQERRETV